MGAPDSRMLDIAWRAGLRGWGDVEPNPLVGCVIAREDAAAPGGWRILGIGHHRRFGGPHAEVEALRACERNRETPRDATAWVTLEPCNHTGKTGPCTRALLDAGVREVIYARADPNPIAAGGAATLRAAGVRARESAASAGAMALAQPFLKGVRTGPPWVIAKWAQTSEGRLTSAPGDARWISGPASRARVHRLRSRVDAVMIGVGTALADDPDLRPRLRAGARVRRTPLRIVLDSDLRLPPDGTLARTARESPVLVIGALEPGPSAAALRAAGVEIVSSSASSPASVGQPPRLDLRAVLSLLARRGVRSVLLEPGPTLLRSALDAGIIDECWAFVAGAGERPEQAAAAAARVDARLADGSVWRPLLSKRSGEDAMCVWRAARES